MIKGKLRPIRDDVLVSHMYFGETKTKGGIIIGDDNAKAHGVKPRWAKVYAVGSEHKDEYDVGDWILIQHGRWTRKVTVDDGDNVLEIQKVEKDAVLAWQDTAPDDFDLAYFGEEA